LHRIMEQRNALRKKKLEEELAVMKPWTAQPWPEMRELRARVNRAGIIRVHNNGYSVPSGLLGKRVTARIFEWKIEVWYGNRLVETVPRLIGSQRYHINYRHVIETLLRKPGGFRNYRYREALFPRFVFRQAWDALQKRFSPRKADIIYLRILKMAADGLESDVAAALQVLLDAKQPWDDESVQQLVQPVQADIPQLAKLPVDLRSYDQLLLEAIRYDAA